jgi:predicted nucleic acid-binding protein
MKPVLVDTSVWRRFFAGSPTYRTLGDLLDEDGAVLVHPFVVGELVMGGLSGKQEELFARLPTAIALPQHEVISFVRQRRLAKRGVGWIDAHLLASALASSALLWSADKALAALASELKVDLRSTAS